MTTGFAEAAARYLEEPPPREEPEDRSDEAYDAECDAQARKTEAATIDALRRNPHAGVRSEA